MGAAGWPWTEESPRRPAGTPAGNPWPKISIVTPSFDQCVFLEAAIRSVLLQGYPDIEFIVMDGGSTDGSVDLLRQYGQWITHWVSEPDRGQSHALNKGIKAATGDLLFWLNADDLCLPEAFGKAAAAFDHPSRPRMVIGNAVGIDESGKVIERWQHAFPSYEEFALHLCTIRQVSCFFDRTLFDELGLVNEDLYYCMDRELLLRFTRDNTPRLIEESLAAFRLQPDAKTQRDMVNTQIESNAMTRTFIEGHPRIHEFFDKRAAFFLDMVDEPGLPFWERLRCLWEAIKLQPRLLRSLRLCERSLAVLRAGLFRRAR